MADFAHKRAIVVRAGSVIGAKWAVSSSASGVRVTGDELRAALPDSDDAPAIARSLVAAVSASGARPMVAILLTGPVSGLDLERFIALAQREPTMIETHSSNTPGTYVHTPPTWSIGVSLILTGGGGGGGSGRKAATGNVGGGSGGAAGGVASYLGLHGGTDVTVTLGAGGTGGTAITGADSNGVSGSAAPASYFTVNGLDYKPGLASGGAAGNTGAGSAATGPGCLSWPVTSTNVGPAGGAGNATSAGNPGGNAIMPTPLGSGGGGGGGYNGTTATNGGAGGGVAAQTSTNPGAYTAEAGPSGGVAGGATPGVPGVKLGGGGFGGGGGAGDAVTGQDGADGATPGGGGGGGGGARTASGKGGTGGSAGYTLIFF